MSLIKVRKLEFGSDNNLEMIIALPQQSTDPYLTDFEVYTQNNISGDVECYIPDGMDYIKAVQRYLESTGTEDPTEQDAFDEMFNKLSETYTEDDNIYDLYQLKADFNWIAADKVGIGIQVYRENLTVIEMKVSDIDNSSTFTIPTECGEDSIVCEVALYDMMPLRLKVLDSIKFEIDSCNCDLPRTFIDKLLQFKTIELALLCNKYCKALQYWNLFFNGNTINSVKSCGCHGKNV